MHLNIPAFAVPLFFALMALEYWLARRHGKAYYNLPNAAANLHVGIAERLMEAFVTGAFFFFYDYLYRHFAIFNIPANAFTWVALLVSTDFVWYWYHRFGHEVNLFWGFHIVHHQSEDFNYTVSARITIFQSVIRTCFWAVLPIIGFPAPMVSTVLLVHGAYSFFTHTRMVGKLGWLERIFVTPSHHRVHHAANEQYLDKNYSDVFIIWDKLFGTFAEENEPPVYGLTHPLKNNSFLWQHFHYLLEISVAMRREKGLRRKIYILLGKPDAVDPRIRLLLERKLQIRRSDGAAEDRLNRYVAWQVGLSLVALFLFLLFFGYASLFFKWQFALLILVTLVNCGAILEKRQWIFPLELVRLVVALSAVVFYAPITWSILAVSLPALAVVLYFNDLKNRYLKLVYKKL